MEASQDGATAAREPVVTPPRLTKVVDLGSNFNGGMNAGAPPNGVFAKAMKQAGVTFSGPNAIVQSTQKFQAPQKFPSVNRSGGMGSSGSTGNGANNAQQMGLMFDTMGQMCKNIGSNGGGDSTGNMMDMMGNMMNQMMQMSQSSSGGTGYGKAQSACGADRTQPYDKEELNHVGPATPDDVDAFLAVHAVEDHAVRRFSDLHPKFQTLVISKGSMLDANNQTAVLMKRCSDVQNMRPGDWVCPGCMDIQWAQNAVCRKCGHDGPNTGHLANVSAAKEKDIAMFLTMHGQIQERAVQKFRSMDPRLQTLIMCKGPMTDVNDQTAVLLGRCKEVNSIRPGDWICPDCMDIQFSNNAMCRRCGKPRSH